MNRRYALSIVFIGLLLAGCQAGSGSAGTGIPTRAENLSQRALSQGYALLYSTISDESEVDKSMIFKSPAPEVIDLLKDISTVCEEGKKQIEAFAKADPTLDLKDQGLPEMELKTRKAISDATTKEVLFNFDKKFEFTILLTQHEALNYLDHIALVLAKDDPNDARQTYLRNLAMKIKVLHDRVIALLEGPYVGAKK